MSRVAREMPDIGMGNIFLIWHMKAKSEVSTNQLFECGIFDSRLSEEAVRAGLSFIKPGKILDKLTSADCR